MMLNENVLGQVETHRNCCALLWGARHEMVIQLQTASLRTALPNVLIDRLLKGRIDYVVDTGAEVSLFKSEVARDLQLDPGKKVRKQELILGDGSKSRALYCEETIGIELGAEWLPVRVLFPVSETTAGMIWRTDFPLENILGLRDVLDERMLCFTPETLFVFGRKPEVE
jgi:hypothetical protein